MNDAMKSMSSHGGILLPLDMFRISTLASVLGEALVSKARNAIGAKLILTRHPETSLVLGRIEGTVVGDDAATFWRENAELALAASQVLPRQCFLYYVKPGAAHVRREGFVVAQRGQVLAADEASAETMPAGASDADWPVTRLCQQMQISVEELASGFAGGPQVEVELLEPHIDDQAAIMKLAGQAEAEGEAGDTTPGGASPQSETPKRESEIQADQKRRAAEQAAEAEQRRDREAAVANALKFAEDDLGIVVAPSASLDEADILRAFLVAEIHGDLPAGLPRSSSARLQGKRIDIAVLVEFLSEVFVHNTPLSRSVFEAEAQPTSLGGLHVKTMEVLAPRLGYGTLIAHERRYVFVSRRPTQPLPTELLQSMLG